MDTTSNQEAGKVLPPYLPFTTFRSAVQNLRAHGLPDRLDRTAWNSRSGADQNLIINTFKFLGLMNHEERPQTVLRELHAAQENSEKERSVLESMLRASYQKLFELNLKAATSGQLDDTIEFYGVTGATRNRAVRFFLKAAHHCGVELSSRLTSGMRSNPENVQDASKGSSSTTPTATLRTRRRRRRTTEPTEAEEEETSGKAVKTLTLRHTTGQLTLSGTFNPFDLQGEERKLVYGMIDLMKSYEQKEETASDDAKI